LVSIFRFGLFDCGNSTKSGSFLFMKEVDIGRVKMTPAVTRHRQL
jgi:hypothetical protein